MKKNQGYSICIRCGKTRILLKRWKDRGVTGKGPVVFHEQTVCPDTECQKIVDERFKEMMDKKVQAENRRKAILEEKALAKSQQLNSTKT